MMFSKKESEYITDKNKFSKNYQYVLQHKIKKKLKEFYKLELPLIKQNENIMRFYNDLTEYYKKEERTRSGPRIFLKGNHDF